MDPAREKKILVWAIIASQFTPPFMFSGVAVALPHMGTDLHAGATALGLVETLFLASQLAFMLPMGRLADASDKRTLYKLGLLCFGLSSLLIGFLSSMPAILGLRFVQGLTSAVFAATGAALLAELVPPEKRGRAYGSSIAALYAGLTLGPVAAGYLSDAWGWRAVFWAGAAILIAGWALISRLMPSTWKTPPAGTVHVPSAALIVGGTLALVGGSAMLHFGAAGYVFLGAGLAMVTGFVLLQKRLAKPLLNVGALMKNHELRDALFVQLLLYMNAFASVFMLNMYMQVSLGHSARVAGQVIAAGTIVMPFLAPVAGHLADKFPPRLVAAAGVVCVLVTTLMALGLHTHSTLPYIIGMLVVQGVGYAFFSSPNMAIIMNSVPPHATSMASALAAKSRSIGMVAGMLMTAVLISNSIGNDLVTQHPERLIDIMNTAYAVLAVTTALALGVSLLTHRAAKKRRQSNA